MLPEMSITKITRVPRIGMLKNCEGVTVWPFEVSSLGLGASLKPLFSRSQKVRHFSGWSMGMCAPVREMSASWARSLSRPEDLSDGPDRLAPPNRSRTPIR